MICLCRITATYLPPTHFCSLRVSVQTTSGALKTGDSGSAIEMDAISGGQGNDAAGEGEQGECIFCTTQQEVTHRILFGNLFYGFSLTNSIFSS